MLYSMLIWALLNFYRRDLHQEWIKRRSLEGDILDLILVNFYVLMNFKKTLTTEVQPQTTEPSVCNLCAITNSHRQNPSDMLRTNVPITSCNSDLTGWLVVLYTILQSITQPIRYSSAKSDNDSIMLLVCQPHAIRRINISLLCCLYLWLPPLQNKYDFTSYTPSSSGEIG